MSKKILHNTNKKDLLYRGGGLSKKINDAEIKLNEIAKIINGFVMPDIGISKLNPLERRYLEEIKTNPKSTSHVYENFMLPIEQNLPRDTEADIHVGKNRSYLDDAADAFEAELNKKPTQNNKSTNNNKNNNIDMLSLNISPLSVDCGEDLAIIINALNKKLDVGKAQQAFDVIDNLNKFSNYEFEDNDFSISKEEDSAFFKEINKFKTDLNMDNLEEEKKRIFKKNVAEVFPLTQEMDNYIEKEESGYLIWNDSYHSQISSTLSELEGHKKKLEETIFEIKKISDQLTEEQNSISKYGSETDSHSNVSISKELIKKVPELKNVSFAIISDKLDSVLSRTNIDPEELKKQKEEWKNKLDDSAEYGIGQATIRLFGIEASMRDRVNSFISNNTLFKGARDGPNITDITKSSEEIISKLEKLAVDVKESQIFPSKIRQLKERFRKFIENYNNYFSNEESDKKILEYAKNSNFKKFISDNPQLVLTDNMLGNSGQLIQTFKSKLEKKQSEKELLVTNTNKLAATYTDLLQSYDGQKDAKYTKKENKIKEIKDKINVKIGEKCKKDGLDEILSKIKKNNEIIVIVEQIVLEVMLRGKVDEKKLKDPILGTSIVDKLNKFISMTGKGIINKTNLESLKNKVELYIPKMQEEHLQNTIKQEEAKLEIWDIDYNSKIESTKRLVDMYTDQLAESTSSLNDTVKKISNIQETLNEFGDPKKSDSNIHILSELVELMPDLRGNAFSVITKKIKDATAFDTETAAKNIEEKKIDIINKLINPDTYGIVEEKTKANYETPKNKSTASPRSSPPPANQNAQTVALKPVQKTSTPAKTSTPNNVHTVALKPVQNTPVTQLKKQNKNLGGGASDNKQYIYEANQKVKKTIEQIKSIKDEIFTVPKKYEEIGKYFSELIKDVGAAGKEYKDKLSKVTAELNNELTEFIKNIETQENTNKGLLLLKGYISNAGFIKFLSSMSTFIIPESGSITDKFTKDIFELEKKKKTNEDLKIALQKSLDDVKKKYNTLVYNRKTESDKTNNEIQTQIAKYKANPPYKFSAKQFNEEKKIWYGPHNGGGSDKIYYSSNYLQIHKSLREILGKNNYNNTQQSVSSDIDGVLMKNEKTLFNYIRYVAQMCSDIDDGIFIPKIMLSSDDIGTVLSKINKIFTIKTINELQYDKIVLNLKIVLGRTERCCNKIALLLRDKPNEFIDITKSRAIIDILLALHVSNKIKL